MIVAELVRNKEYLTITPYEPFIWKGYINYWDYLEDWPDTWEDLIVARNRREKVKQVSVEFLYKYIEADSYADCRSQRGSFYYDRINQVVYINFRPGESPLVNAIDYGLAFGLSGSAAGVQYIDDYEYLPLVESFIDLEVEADIVGINAPTEVAGSLALINTEYINPVTSKREGHLDFLLSESIYGNDVFIYDFVDGDLSEILCLFVEDFEIDLERVTLNVNDKRFH